MNNKTRDKESLSRRDFLGLASLGAAILSILTILGGVFRMTKASVHYEESKKIRIGKPDEFPIGTEKKFYDKNIFVFSDYAGIYAISAICTHLGCIVHSTKWGFQCPCHGSKFNKNGKVIVGPAPRNLPWHEVSKHADGSLLVDAGKDVKAGTKFIA